jgi:hypothetical protein
MQELSQGAGGLSAAEVSKLNGTFPGQRARIAWIRDADISGLPSGIYGAKSTAPFNKNDATIVHSAFVNNLTLLTGADHLYNQIQDTSLRRQQWRGLTIQVANYPPQTVR